MARFYGKFDSGSGGWVTALDNDYFERRRIGADSASGARLRDGLISSRSAVSADAYADIPFSYENGQLGTIVPGDNYSTNGSTFVSWSRAGGAVFTSSTATSATWGVIIPSNYRTRPTASILSTNTLIGGPTASVGVSYTAYTNATTAVRAVLDLVQNGAGTLAKVYDRLGNNISRTLHSIWHDENLQYFGWDDFTPGQLSTSGMSITPSMADCNQTPSPGATSTIQFTWNSVSSYTYRNDGNSTGRIGVEMEIAKAAGATGTCDTNWGTPRFRLQLGYAATTHGGPLTMGTSTSGNGQTNPSSNGNCGGTSTWTWNGQGTYNSGATPNVSWTVKLEDCISPGWEITVSTLLYDATITTSTNTAQPGIITAQAANPNVA
jgi:hypothetical protein